MERTEGYKLSRARSRRVVVTGAAGLVGQNLVFRLKANGYTDIVAIDKHRANSATLRELHPDIQVIEADLAVDEGWQKTVYGADAVVCGHAQIGGLDHDAFIANNVIATKRLVQAVKAANVRYLVHISSSVVNSTVVDWYAESKKKQEKIILESGIRCAILRPTLMFGWFDRKHLGWLVRFMKRTPIFPIPGHGRYMRQPLYVYDFCDVIVACLERQLTGVYDISGLHHIAYLDLIRVIRNTLGLKTPLVKTPYWVFWMTLKAYSFLARNPPFTTHQLEALVTPDVFDVINWPEIFGVQATPLDEALRQTFLHPKYSNVSLDF